MFDHTKKIIVPHAEWVRYNEAEVCLVKNLDGDEHKNKGIWTENACRDNIYEQNKITVVKVIKENIFFF